jgi:hypothetical protein
MALLGYPRHLSKFVKHLFSALTMRSTEYPQRVHNVFPIDTTAPRGSRA